MVYSTTSAEKDSTHEYEVCARAVGECYKSYKRTGSVSELFTHDTFSTTSENKN